MRNRLPLWLLTVTTALALIASGGCGVRGALETPPKAVSDVPASKPGEPPPHKPFILDPLIR